MKEKYLNDNVKRLGEPFALGLLGLFIYPSAKRYFKKNPITENPDKEDWCKLYWENSPRSAICLGLGVLTTVAEFSSVITEGLEKISYESDPSSLLISGGIFTGTNLFSGTWELARKYL